MRIAAEGIGAELQDIKERFKAITESEVEEFEGSLKEILQRLQADDGPSSPDIDLDVGLEKLRGFKEEVEDRLKVRYNIECAYEHTSRTTRSFQAHLWDCHCQKRLFLSISLSLLFPLLLPVNPFLLSFFQGGANSGPKAVWIAHFNLFRPGRAQ